MKLIMFGPSDPVCIVRVREGQKVLQPEAFAFGGAMCRMTIAREY